jgi:hemolysin D
MEIGPWSRTETSALFTRASRIKIDTFNFTRYGLLLARCSASRRMLSFVTARRIVPTSGAGDAEQQQRAARPGLNYTALISLDRPDAIDDRVVNLSPGMAATVEIKTGSRTLLNISYRHCSATAETLRER